MKSARLAAAVASFTVNLPMIEIRVGLIRISVDQVYPLICISSKFNSEIKPL
jgi:hypothetical protein